MNDMDGLRNAPDKDEGELTIEDDRDHSHRPLKPGEIPGFPRQRHTHQNAHEIKSVTTKPGYIASTGQLIDSYKDVKGVCYVALAGGTPVPGCGVLVKKRKCAAPNCDRLLCTVHAHQHPKVDDQYFCEEHWKEFRYEQHVEWLENVLYFLFEALVTLLWIGLSVFPLLIPGCLVCWSLKPLVWWWRQYPWRSRSGGRK